MKKVFLSIVAIAALVALPMSVSAQKAQFDNGTQSTEASVTIVTPLALTKVTDLSFGTIASGNADGTVTLTQAGVASYLGGAQKITTAAAPFAASFTLTGQSNYGYNVSVSSSVIDIESDGALVVTLDYPTATQSLTSGTGSFSIGGELAVKAESAPGLHKKSFNVTVNYN